jgi:hypothetical protein
MQLFSGKPSLKVIYLVPARAKPMDSSFDEKTRAFLSALASMVV